VPLARRLSALGVGVDLAALDVEQLKGPADERGAKTFAVDASNPSAVARLFLDTERLVAEPDVVIYNASYRVSGKLTVLTVAYGMAVAAQSEASRDCLKSLSVEGGFGDLFSAVNSGSSIPKLAYSGPGPNKPD
jgi:NAD(P)-dependent dehydrogenase (short-subunit alcohol dehydrogenase family)